VGAKPKLSTSGPHNASNDHESTRLPTIIQAYKEHCNKTLVNNFTHNSRNKQKHTFDYIVARKSFDKHISVKKSTSKQLPNITMVKTN
jgi:hypothetical protein